MAVTGRPWQFAVVTQQIQQQSQLTLMADKAECLHDRHGMPGIGHRTRGMKLHQQPLTSGL